MADWYVSSAAYAGISAFVASHAYSIGNIVKPTAPALKAQWVFRCTTAGTSSTEPTWPTADGATITTGGATFTNVTGRSAYGWAAAAGDMPTLIGAVGTNRFASGDRMFVSSDHSETQTTATTYGATTGASFTSGQVLSVNRAGSVPPVAADLTVGATVTISGVNQQMTIDTVFPLYCYGINFAPTSTSSAGIQLAFNGYKAIYFDACKLFLNSAASASRLYNGSPLEVVLNNSTLQFSNAGQAIQGAFLSGSPYTFELAWFGGSVIGATVPSVLFLPINFNTLLITCRGVDLSGVTGTLVQNAIAGANAGSKYLFDSCRIAAGVTRYSSTNLVNTRDLVELINCYDGTSIINESYQSAGVLTTERTITLSGGATDDVGTFSHKLVSGTNIDKYVNPLFGFWMDVEQTAVGSSKTATVEIISSLTLNNDDISLLLEYQGTSGSPVASFANTLPNVLTTGSAIVTSTATWNSSPATPVRQRLQTTFTPQLAGRVRGQVRLGRASTTVYVNPVITIT